MVEERLFEIGRKAINQMWIGVIHNTLMNREVAGRCLRCMHMYLYISTQLASVELRVFCTQCFS